MASIIRIKRSSVAGNPSTLAAGELAYSALTDNGSNGGDRLYIGMGTETAGNAANHIVIGGKFFTDRLDHTAGILTASSALVVDSNKKLDELLVDNLSLNGSTLSSTGEIILASASGVTLQTNEFIQGGSYGGNRLYLPTGGGATLQSGYEGGVTLRASTNNTDWVTVTLATSGSLTIPGTIATANNGNLTLSPNGTGLVSIAGAYTLPRVDGTNGYVLTTNGTGTVSWAASSSSLSIGSDGGVGSIDLLTETLTVSGGEGIDTSISGNTITIAAELATSSNAGIATFNTNGFVVTTGDVALKSNVVQGITTDTGALTVSGNGISILGGEGVDVTHSDTTITIAAELATSSNAGVATFNTASFGVTAGDVTIKTGGVSNSQLANSSLTIGSTTTSLGGTSTALAGLTQLTVDNIDINGNTVGATNANGTVILAPLGSGTVDVSSKRITSVAEPTQATDAATKGYVDAVKTGLDVKESVRAATTANITTTNTQTVDGVVLVAGDRVLVKDQSTGSQNGIYVVVDAGAWTRAIDFDNTPGTEVTSGAFTFVEEGTVNADSGWVLTTNGAITLGTTALTFAQFSGAGQVVAGAGLTKTGNTLDVQVGTGIAIVSDTVTLASSVAGAGLTFNSGVLNVEGTADRITVATDSVDIASTYVGQTSITTLGTVTTGTWSATTIGTTKGGTGLTSYATGDLLYASASNTLSALTAGTDGKVLQMNSSGVPVWGDVDGGTY